MKSCRFGAAREAVELHHNVVDVIKLLTARFTPKQILINIHVSLKNDLTNAQMIRTIAEIEEKMKQAEPKVDKIFLETAGITEKEDGTPRPPPSGKETKAEDAERRA